MGEDTVTAAAQVAGLEDRPSVTDSLHLHGWREGLAADAPWQVYGSDATALEQLLVENPGWGEPLHPALPYCAAEVIWGVRHEWARTVEDILSRRTRALLLDARASIDAAPQVAELMAQELGRDRAWQEAQVAGYFARAREYLLA
jgi:glycerol-3-phosphate dehydrogenase